MSPCKLIIFCCHIHCIGFDFLRNDSYSSVCNISLSWFLLMNFFFPKKNQKVFKKKSKKENENAKEVRNLHMTLKYYL